MTMLEALGSILIGLVVIAGAAAGLNYAFSNSKLSDTQQNIITLRMNIQHFFSGSTDFTGLDNALAIKTGLVPKAFIKGSNLGNAWGGTITLEPVTTDGAFSITFGSIPQEVCTKLARFQSEAWLKVAVNGTETSGADIATAASACTAINTIEFLAR